MQQIYGQNSRRSPYIIVTDMTYLLVNWTDVTSTESAFTFANKIRDRAHKRTLTILTLCSLVHGPPFRAESGDLIISLRSYVGGLVRETRYNRTLYCMVLKQYGISMNETTSYSCTIIILYPSAPGVSYLSRAFILKELNAAVGAVWFRD